MNNMPNICPLPWMHLSVHSDKSLRICCNAGEGREIVDENDNVIFYDLKNDINQIFNYSHYKKIRKQMMNKIWPKACLYCRDLSNKGGGGPFDIFSHQYKDEIPGLLLNTNSVGEISNLEIKFIDFSLGSKCNLKCRMCSPEFSSSLIKVWEKSDIEFSSSQIKRSLETWDFSEDDLIHFDKVFGSMDKLLLQGGEPLISQDVEKLLELLILRGFSENINLKFTTNATRITTKLMNLLVQFKAVGIYISIEGTNHLNEFIREGISSDVFFKNISILNKMKTVYGFALEFCTVFQIYNFFDIIPFLESLKSNSHGMPLIPYFNYLRYPDYLSINILPYEIRVNQVSRIKDYLKKNIDKYRESKITMSNLDTLYSCLELSLAKIDNDKELLNEFFIYNKNMDKEYSKNLFEFIPELKEVFKNEED